MSWLFLQTKCNDSTIDSTQRHDNEESRLFPKSEFDKMLLAEWNVAVQNGLFKFEIDEKIKTRYLPGKYSLAAQVWWTHDFIINVMY